MPAYYVDTSALMKRYRTEAGTDVVNELFAGARPDDLFLTSQLTIVEVEAVAARALKARIFNRRTYGVLLSLFAQDLSHYLTVIPVSPGLVSNSVEVARSYGLRAADCIHLATALQAQDITSSPTRFVGSDSELYRVAQSAGLESLNPADNRAMAVLQGWRS